ncbi:MAG: hypothetical protein V4683_20360 [Bacteroidota bacterium]
MNYTIITIISIVLISCNIKRIDTSQMADQMKNAEIKRITPTQISSFANDWGIEITEYLNEKPSNLQNIDSLSKLYHASIKKVDIANLNLDTLDKKEAELMQAYQYSLQNNQAIGTNLQKLQGGEIQLFTASIPNVKNQIWRVEFTKKEIIRRVNVKEIKKITVQ